MKLKQLVWSGDRRVVVMNAGSMVAAMATTSGLGFAYWTLAAHWFSPAAVGLGAASISAMSLLSTIGVFGLGTLLMGELRQNPGSERTLIALALLVTCLSGGTLGVGFAVASQLVSSSLAPLGSSLGHIALFGAGASLTAMTLVLDQTMIGLFRGGLQFARNVIFSTTKLLALAVAALLLSRRTGMSLYATWTLGNLVSVIWLVGVLLWTGRGKRSQGVNWPTIRGMSRLALPHHGVNLALQAPGLAIPVLVTILFSASANAYFYAAWMMAGLIMFAPVALSTVLYAVGASSKAELADRMRFSIKLSLLLGLAANVGLLAVGNLVLGWFGRAYAINAAASLHVLALAVFPQIVRDHYVAVRRVQGRLMGAFWMVGAGAVLELFGAALGGMLGGEVGLSLGWLVAVCVEALMMFNVVHMACKREETVGVDTLLPSWRRIHIVGCPGSGKSTLARRLAVQLGLPAYNLDEIAFEDGHRVKRPLKARLTLIDSVLNQPARITEGVYLDWTEELLRQADVIIWLPNVALPVIAWRLIRRWLASGFGTPADTRSVTDSAALEGSDGTGGGLRKLLRPNRYRGYLSSLWELFVYFHWSAGYARRATAMRSPDDDDAVSWSETARRLACHAGKVVDDRLRPVSFETLGSVSEEYDRQRQGLARGGSRR